MIATFRSIVLIVIVFGISRTAAQDPPDSLYDSWQNLKKQLYRKTEIATNLVAVIRKYRKDKKETIQNIESTAADVRLIIDSSKGFDSSTIIVTSQKNMLLTGALSKGIFLFIEDSKLKSQQDLRTLQMQLEGAKNRIAVARRNYNEICIASGRNDLVFADK